MKVTFLGTGTSQGVPVIACECDVCSSADPRDKRYRNSVLISDGGKNVVIDTGPDFRSQMLDNQVMHLNGVVFTHEHKDHIAGLDDIRSFNFKQQEDMNVYATDRVQEALQREYNYIFSAYKYPGIPQVKLHDVNDDPFEVAGMQFIPIEVMHYKLPVKAYRMNNFTYITDAKTISEDEKEKIKGSKVIVVNALRKEEHISHFNLEQALAFIEEMAPEKAYLSHISHLMGKHADVESELPDHVRIAHDGLTIEI